MRLSGGRAINHKPSFTTIPIDCRQDGARRQMEFFVLTANNFTFFSTPAGMQISCREPSQDLESSHFSSSPCSETAFCRRTPGLETNRARGITIHVLMELCGLLHGPGRAYCAALETTNGHQHSMWSSRRNGGVERRLNHMHGDDIVIFSVSRKPRQRPPWPQFVDSDLAVDFGTGNRPPIGRLAALD